MSAIFQKFVTYVTFPRSLCFAVVLCLAGMAASSQSGCAEEPEAAAFMRHITSLQPIFLSETLGDNLTRVTFFGPVRSSAGSKTVECADGCPVPGAIMIYASPRRLVTDITLVPLVWAMRPGDSAKILSLVRMDYKPAYRYDNLDMPGSVETSRSGRKKEAIFFQARYDSKPVTLVFIADLDPSRAKQNSSKVAARIAILEFTQSKIKGQLIGKFEPIISYTTRKYSDADLAMNGEFGFQLRN